MYEFSRVDIQASQRIDKQQSNDFNCRIPVFSMAEPQLEVRNDLLSIEYDVNSLKFSK